MASPQDKLIAPQTASTRLTLDANRRALLTSSPKSKASRFGDTFHWLSAAGCGTFSVDQSPPMMISGVTPRVWNATGDSWTNAPTRPLAQVYELPVSQPLREFGQQQSLQ